MPQLEFKHFHRYVSQSAGIPLPVTLRNADRTVDLLAYVDTGAANCLFERGHADILNIEI